MTTTLEATARRDLYALTARLFAAEVDVPLYRALLTHDTLGFIDQELGRLGEEPALEVLAVEFCRLFVGPQPLCVPYASAYRGEALLGGRGRVWKRFCTTLILSMMRQPCVSPPRITWPSNSPCWRICTPVQMPLQ